MNTIIHKVFIWLKLWDIAFPKQLKIHTILNHQKILGNGIPLLILLK